MTLRIAVTGATSDFAKAILPALLEDDDVESVLGIARRPVTLSHPKLESIRSDIRSPRLENVFRGYDVILHLAFVVEELRDKKQTHDINQRGSRNVLDCAYRAGVRRLVIASSINAYGAEIHDEPLNESHYPAGDPDRYYFHDKAEVEHYAEWWLRRHPGEMAVSMLRPTYIIGPDFSNDGIDQFTGRVGAFPRADEASYQFLHQTDLADAFHRATKQDLVGPFNVGPRDRTRVRELADMQGQRLFDVPERAAVVAANVAFRLGLTPFSGQWVTAGEPVVDSTALHETTGWSPTLTSNEAAAVMVLLQGRPILGAEFAVTSLAACEAALAPASDHVDTTGGNHVQLSVPTGTVHCEVHGTVSSDGTVSNNGTVVVPVRPGLHARYHTPLASTLHSRGYDVVLVDLPGHGLSTGRRGHVDRMSFDTAVAEAVEYARAEFGTHVTIVDVGDCPTSSSDGLVPRRIARKVRGRALYGSIPYVPTKDGIIAEIERVRGATTTAQRPMSSHSRMSSPR